MKDDNLNKKDTVDCIDINANHVHVHINDPKEQSSQQSSAFYDGLLFDAIVYFGFWLYDKIVSKQRKKIPNRPSPMPYYPSLRPMPNRPSLRPMPCHF